MSWFIRRGGRSFGPYSFAQIKTAAGHGQLSPVDELLQQGTTQWTQAGNVPGLFSSSPGPIGYHQAPTKPVVTEATAKKWKGMQLVGGVMLIGGCVGTVASVGSTPGKSTDPPVIAPILLLAGLTIYVFARVNAWWNHG